MIPAEFARPLTSGAVSRPYNHGGGSVHFPCVALIQRVFGKGIGRCEIITGKIRLGAPERHGIGKLRDWILV